MSSYKSDIYYAPKYTPNEHNMEAFVEQTLNRKIFGEFTRAINNIYIYILMVSSRLQVDTFGGVSNNSQRHKRASLNANDDLVTINSL